MALTRTGSPGRVRPAKSPLKSRPRKITHHGDKPPFATPVPVAVAAVTATPVYLTQAEPPKADLFDHLQVLACIAFLAIVTVALVGPSAMAEATNLISGHAPSPPTFVPLQHRGPFGWAWTLFRSVNDW